MIAWLLEPRPYPAFVLLAIIFMIFGFVLRPVGIFFWVIAVIFLLTFIRGLIIDLSIDRVGVQAFGRVTKVEGQTIHFTFTDQRGGVHEQTIEDEGHFSEGAAVKIRYHPEYPDEIWRWLE